MTTSFINERSAEYYLIPHLKRELEMYFRYVTPVFPWLNRETSKISRLIHGNDEFKILAIFSRRPKINPGDDQSIYVTINPELIEFQSLAFQNDIPVIAGCPLATNFWHLSQCNDFAWIEINNQIPEKYLIMVSSYGNNSSDLHKLSIEEIVNQINESKYKNIEQFSEFIKKTKNLIPRRFIFGPRYKPVYLLVKSH